MCSSSLKQWPASTPSWVDTVTAISREFADWSIEEYLPSISCPTLIIQAEDDEYATIAQPDRIAAEMTVEPELLWLPFGGHSPHLTVTDPVSEAIVEFVERSSGGGSVA